MDIINISNLSFGYTKDHPILKELNMNVPSGSIYGFLGTNGAGKSTTIRNILKLLRPQSGTIQLFGEAEGSSQLEQYQKIGSLIESPSLYPQLNAWDNLRIACQYRNIDHARIEPVLSRLNNFLQE